MIVLAIRGFCAAISLWVFVAPSSALAQVFVIEPLTYRLRDEGAEPEFRVFATDTLVRDLKVTLKELKDPDGRALAVQGLTVTQDQRETTPDGARVRLKPDPAFFTAPGDYRAALLIEGRAGDKPVTIQKVATFTRDKIELDLEPLKNLIVRVYRPFPGCTVTDHVSIELANDGKSAIRRLAAHGDMIIGKDRREIVPGTVALSRTNGRPANDIEMPPRERVSFDIAFSGLRYAGTFTTGLTFVSPSFDKPQRLALVLEVTDRWPWPLTVIALGVIAAFVVNFVAKRWRPAQEQRYRIRRAVSDLLRWRDRVQTDRKRQELDRLEDLSRKADDAIGVSDSQGVTKLIEELEKGLEAFRKAEGEQLATVWTQVDRLRSQVAEGRTRPGLPDEVRQALDRVDGFLQETENRLRASRVDAALEAVTTAEKEFAKIALPAADAAVRVRGARLMVAGPDAAGAEAPAVEVVDPPDARTTDAAVSFQLVPAAALPAGASVVWTFGDGSAEVSGGASVRHRFASSGTFLVTASVQRAQAEVAKAFARINVDPSRGELELRRLRRRMLWAEFGISAFALLVAALTGFWALWVGKVFGTPADYLTAFLWGLGIDSTVRGFGTVMKKFGEA